MQILILGCGYLGKRAAKTWIEAGHNVFAVTRSEQTGQLLRQIQICPIVADICEPSSLRSLPTVDVVLHAVGFDRTSGHSQEEVTYGGVQNVLNAVGDRCGRFILISSTSVFGQSNGEWVDESSECQPTQLGGKLNLAAERLALSRYQSSVDGCANVLRLAGIYGPGRLLSRIDSLRSNAVIPGRADAWLNLIHVDDAVSIVVRCSTMGEPGAIYNVVDDCPVERGIYFGRLAELVGAPRPVFDPTQERDRGSGGVNKRCSNHKLKKTLGWSPQFSSYESGLPASVADLTA